MTQAWSAKGMGDFGSEESIAELVEQLKKQEGWKKRQLSRQPHHRCRICDHRHDGHGFAFPLVDGGAAIMPFVTMTRRKDGSVKVVGACLFRRRRGRRNGQPGRDGGAQAISKAPQPKPEGTFTLTTDGRILTNNTEDGPTSAAGDIDAEVGGQQPDGQGPGSADRPCWQSKLIG